MLLKRCCNVGFDDIQGMLYDNESGALFVNVASIYDAPAQIKNTTMIFYNASNLASSSVTGYFGFEGKMENGFL